MVKENNDKQKLEIMNPDAAGIDIGSREHYVCVQLEEIKKLCIPAAKLHNFI